MAKSQAPELGAGSPVGRQKSVIRSSRRRQPLVLANPGRSAGKNRLGGLVMSSMNLPRGAGLLLAMMLCAPAAVAGPPLAERLTPISDEVALAPSPNDWLMWRRT